jgi:hypothetical protein
MHAICADFKGSGGVSHEFWAKMPKNVPRAQKYYLRLMVDSQESILVIFGNSCWVILGDHPWSICSGLSSSKQSLRQVPELKTVAGGGRC